MHNLRRFIDCLLYHPRVQTWIKLIMGLVLFGICLDVFASDGTDLLQGSDSNAWATLNGTGKNWLYLGEGLIGLFTYMKTKNIFALVGILVVSIFLNVILKMAGQNQ